MYLGNVGRRNIYQKSFGTFIFLAAMLLSACSFTTASPTPLPDTDPAPVPETPTEEIPPTEPVLVAGTSIVQFPDGSEITLFSDAIIDIITILDLAPEVHAHAITLQKGHIIVNSQLPDGIWFSVLNPFNYVAVVTGSIIELAFDPSTGLYIMDCKEGVCKMGIDNEHLFDILEQQQGCLDQAGNFFGPFDNVAFEELADLCQNGIPAATLTPVAQQPSETPDIRASATAACNEFEGEFPGTPCP